MLLLVVPLATNVGEGPPTVPPPPPPNRPPAPAPRGVRVPLATPIAERERWVPATVSESSPLTPPPPPASPLAPRRSGIARRGGITPGRSLAPPPATVPPTPMPPPLPMAPRIVGLATTEKRALGEAGEALLLLLLVGEVRSRPPLLPRRPCEVLLRRCSTPPPPLAVVAVAPDASPIPTTPPSAAKGLLATGEAAVGDATVASNAH